MLIKTRDAIFELQDNETLLEALERTGHYVEYQCRNGYCGSCRLKLRSGCVSYSVPPLAFVAADEVLPCCCQVKETIEIEASLKETVQQADLFDIDLFTDQD